MSEAEFSQFVQANARSLQRAAWLLTGSWTSADDLVQAALLKLWRTWDRVDPQREPLAYARRIMLNTYLHWRRRQWTKELSFSAVPEQPLESDAYRQSELRTVLLGALSKLPRQQRAAIVLRYFEDLDEQATARAMGCSPGAVKAYTSRGLAALRKSPGIHTSDTRS